MSETAYKAGFVIQDLIDLRVHFGHKVSALNPKMRDYVFGTKNGMSIIDVRKTYDGAMRALDMCYKFGKMNKRVLFVGTAPQVAPIIKEYAERCGQFYVADRWLGGILTNWYTVSKSIKTLMSYDKLLDDVDSGLSKKEILTVTKKRDKLVESFGGLKNLRGRPDLVIVFNTRVDYLAVKEALAIGIPIIALLDTDADVTGITCPIVSNDDSVAVIKFFCDQFMKAIMAGVQDGMKASGVDVSNLVKSGVNKNDADTKDADIETVDNSSNGDSSDG